MQRQQQKQARFERNVKEAADALEVVLSYLDEARYDNKDADDRLKALMRTAVALQTEIRQTAQQPNLIPAEWQA